MSKPPQQPDPAVAEAFRQVAADRAAHRKTHAAQARRQAKAAERAAR